MKFEIINPSDKCFIEGEDFKTVCLATAILGNGLYGLAEVGVGELKMPVIAFDTKWFEEYFKQDISKALTELPQKELKKVLETVVLAGEQSSHNDIVGYAEGLVKSLKDDGSD